MTPETGPAFVAALAASHGSQLRRFLLVRVRNSADVPDLVQEIYLRMLRIPDHDAVRSPEAYLFTVAQHVAHQHLIRQSNVAPPTELQDMLVELAQIPNDPAGEVSAQQSLEELEHALHRLSPRDYIGLRFPDMRDAPVVETRACNMESTADDNFIIDRHPSYDNVWLASGGGGHGFKHGPLVGEYVADRIMGRPSADPAADKLFQLAAHADQRAAGIVDRI